MSNMKAKTKKPAPRKLRWFTAFVNRGKLAELKRHPNQLAVLMVLYAHANSHTLEAWPGAIKLGKRTGVARNHASEARTALRKKGYITELGQPPGGRSRHEGMKVRLNWPAKKAAT